MNGRHLELCSSAEWADAVQRWIIPWALDAVDLGGAVVEIGPGPGLTTDVLRTRAGALTAVELDPDLAAALADRLPDVRVVRADAAHTGLPAGSFDVAVSLTMLHHVPDAATQDAVFAEMRRLLRPGGVFAGSDSRDSPDFRDLHEGDVCAPIDPATLEARLRTAGFAAVLVETNEHAVRFEART
jgi:SAM-dependent methyltransferase